MALFSFGKKKRVRSTRKSGKKPPAALLKKCRKFKIKTTMKKGNKKVYRKVRVLKKLLAKRMRKLHKKRHTKRRVVHRRKRVVQRRRGMGFGEVTDYPFNPSPVNYGYNTPVQQYPGTLSQSSTVSNEKMNISRPEGTGVPQDNLPVYGVYRNFFGQDVPTQIPPNWDFMGQPDGSVFAVGSPFQRYTKPIAFGKKRLRRYNVPGSPCNKLRKRVCRSSPNCSYTKRGCRRRKGTVSKGLVFEGPSLAFGKRLRRYNVAGSVCNKLPKRICRSSPNCSYTKRGCRRRSGTVSKGLVFEGPSLAFGKRLRRYNVAGSVCNKLPKRICRSSPNCSYTKRGCRRRKGTVSKGLVFEGPSLAFGRRRF